MPIYEYISKNPKKGCKVCSDGFELNRPIDRAPLEKIARFAKNLSKN